MPVTRADPLCDLIGTRFNSEGTELCLDGLKIAYFASI